MSILSVNDNKRERKRMIREGDRNWKRECHGAVQIQIEI